MKGTHAATMICMNALALLDFETPFFVFPLTQIYLAHIVRRNFNLYALLSLGITRNYLLTKPPFLEFL